MLQSEQSPNDFLTEEESLAVDQTLMPAKDKFSTRVAIYSLRVLQSMETSSTDPHAIIDWLTEHQPSTFEVTPGLEPDPAFNRFFAQLVLSALNPLNRISAQLNKPIVELTPAEIIAWFEQNVRL